MEIRWSPDAAADLEGIIEYIERDSPVLAQRTGRAIYERLQMLGTFPHSGRHGRIEGTRELLLPPLPFIVVYRVRQHAGVVEIVNIIHGAQRWPPAN